MTKMQTLKRQAKETAAFRGHNLTRFKTLHSNAAAADCKVCGGYVFANTRPLPNEIDLAGNVLALSCEDIKRSYPNR